MFNACRGTQSKSRTIARRPHECTREVKENEIMDENRNEHEYRTNFTIGLTICLDEVDLNCTKIFSNIFTQTCQVLKRKTETFNFKKRRTNTRNKCERIFPVDSTGKMRSHLFLVESHTISLRTLD